jgi:RNA polymerase sigma-70 factor (ECF subfamily)
VDQATETLPRSPEAGERIESAGSRLGGRPSASDEEVVARVRAGETPLFELLIRRYNQRLYRVARSILRDEQEAEDVMQHAYVSAFAHLGQFEGRARFSTWLTRIAVHEALARRRKRWREPLAMPPLEAQPPSPRSPETDPEAHALHVERRRLLAAAIDALPATYRGVFVMTQLEGLTGSEVAARLGLRPDAVRARLHRARSRLRSALRALA